jgi:hypothetical protein
VGRLPHAFRAVAANSARPTSLTITRPFRKLARANAIGWFGAGRALPKLLRTFLQSFLSIKW